MNNTAYISLGSNVGDKYAYLRRALELLEKHPDVTVSKVSSFYATEPIGYAEQDWFLNAAAELDTALEPLPLLQYLLDIEQQCRRMRKIRWGPRTLDLDLLLYGQLTMHHPDLELPHPRMLERAFVLIPLLEIAPHLCLPDGTSLREVMQQPDLLRQTVRLVERAENQHS